ncbi:MAG: hypothetical protein PHX34_00830 [Candidatus Shapirobacteria bacterium]|nr:hypothetical protein [Candidatus Shapirobacteria bacterium]
MKWEIIVLLVIIGLTAQLVPLAGEIKNIKEWRKYGASSLSIIFFIILCLILVFPFSLILLINLEQKIKIKNDEEVEYFTNQLKSAFPNETRSLSDVIQNVGDEVDLDINF